MSRSFTPNAAEDALDIWEYITADESDRIADKVIARIYDECEVISTIHGARNLKAFLKRRE